MTFKTGSQRDAPVLASILTVDVRPDYSGD